MRNVEDDEIVIIIPVYNEAKVIGKVIGSVKEHFTTIICVDDGSTDSSAREITKTGVQLVKHPFNLGQGAALQTGLDYALLNSRTKYFVTYDADGQHSIKDVLMMLETIRNKKVDVVLGSRFLGTVENIPRLKKLILKLAVIFSNTTSGVLLTDTHNGLRVLNRNAASLLNITMADFSHASEIIECIGQKKLTHTEVPVTIQYTQYSKKKGQSILNLINISFDVLLRKVTK